MGSQQTHPRLVPTRSLTHTPHFEHTRYLNMTHFPLFAHSCSFQCPLALGYLSPLLPRLAELLSRRVEQLSQRTLSGAGLKRKGSKLLHLCTGHSLSGETDGRAERAHMSFQFHKCLSVAQPSAA